MKAVAAMKALVIGLIGAMAAGCAGGLHSDGPPTQIYVLRATAAARNAEASGAGSDGAGAAMTHATAASGDATAAPSVQLPRPSADPGLGSELITLVRTDHRLDYYLGSRWAADLPDVVETLAIDTLRASGAWG